MSFNVSCPVNESMEELSANSLEKVADVTIFRRFKRRGMRKFLLPYDKFRIKLKKHLPNPSTSNSYPVLTGFPLAL